jgi:hypothetical protein
MIARTVGVYNVDEASPPRRLCPETVHIGEHAISALRGQNQKRSRLGGLSTITLRVDGQAGTFQQCDRGRSVGRVFDDGEVADAARTVCL